MGKTGKIKIQMSMEDMQLFREMKRLEDKYGSITNAIKQMGRASDKTGQKQKKAGREAGAATGFATTQIKSLITSYVGAAGLLSAVKQIVGAYDKWKDKMYEIGKATKTAMDSMIAFVALQEPGKKRERLMEALSIAAKFGVKDVGLATSITQAMQSVPGRTWAEAKTAVRGIFAAKQVGIPIAAGAEAEIIASTQGMKPGEALWRAYVIGQASQRAPADIVKGAPALSFFQRPETGFAAAGVLAGTRGGKLEVFLRQLGVALSKTSALGDTFQRLGVAEATQREKLEALFKAGFRTPEQLHEVGLTEIRQRIALSDVLKNMDLFNKGLRVQREAQAEGINVLVRHRRQIEKELPVTRAGREMGMAAARLEQARVTGPQGLRGAQMVTEARALSTVLTRRGIYTAFGTELAKESGEAVAKTWPLIAARYPREYLDIKREYQREVDAIRLERASDARRRIVGELRGARRHELAGQIRDLPYGIDPMLQFMETEISRREAGGFRPVGGTEGLSEAVAAQQERKQYEQETALLLREIRDSLRDQATEAKGKNRTLVKPNVDEGVGVK